VQGATLHGLVDLGYEATVLRVDAGGVTLGDDLLEAVEMGLHAARKAPVLIVLASAAKDPLLL
jgi:hypothetical protein